MGIADDQGGGRTWAASFCCPRATQEGGQAGQAISRRPRFTSGGACGRRSTPEVQVRSWRARGINGIVPLLVLLHFTSHVRVSPRSSILFLVSASSSRRRCRAVAAWEKEERTTRSRAILLRRVLAIPTSVLNCNVPSGRPCSAFYKRHSTGVGASTSTARAPSFISTPISPTTGSTHFHA